MVFSASAQAAKTWNGSGITNDWSEGANWVGGAVPGATDSVTFDGTSSKDCTINNVGLFNARPFTITSGYGGTITLNTPITTAAFSLAGGVFNQNAAMTTSTFATATGTFNANANLNTGALTLTSGSVNIADDVTVTTTNNYIQNGGTMTIGTSKNTALLKVTGASSYVNLNNGFMIGTGSFDCSTTLLLGVNSLPHAILSLYDLTVGTSLYIYYGSSVTVRHTLTTGRGFLLRYLAPNTLITGTYSNINTTGDAAGSQVFLGSVYFNNGPSDFSGTLTITQNQTVEFQGPYVHTFAPGSLLKLVNSAGTTTSLKLGGSGTNASNMTVFRSSSPGNTWAINDQGRMGLSMGPWADFKDVDTSLVSYANASVRTCANCTNSQGLVPGTHPIIFNPENIYWQGSGDGNWNTPANWKRPDGTTVGTAGTVPSTGYNAIFPYPDTAVYGNNCMVDANVHPHSIQMPASMTGYGSTQYSGTLNWGQNKTIQIDTGLYNQGLYATAAGTSSVQFPDTSETTILGNNNFYDLVISGTVAKSVYFESGKTQTVTNSLTITGTNPNLISLVPTGTARWLLKAPASQTISRVTPSYSNACSGSKIISSNSTDGGNNYNWAGMPGELGCSAVNAIFFGTDF